MSYSLQKLLILQSTFPPMILSCCMVGMRRVLVYISKGTSESYSYNHLEKINKISITIFT